MRLRRWIVTFLAALLVSFISLFMLMPLGLGVSFFVVLPLALLLAALLAALTAGWIGTWLATDGTRTRLGPTIVSMEAMAVVLALLFITLVVLRVTIFVPPIRTLVISSLLLGLSASVAAERFRRSAQARDHDVLLTAALLALAVVSVPLAIFFASLFGLTGA